VVGNDIIDLKQAKIDSNWKRNGYLNKVFSKKEQTYILSSDNKTQAVWLLWSMKEAAYKIHIQLTGKAFFNPKKISCNLISLTEGLVTINKFTFKTKTVYNVNYIYTTATSTNFKAIKSNCFRIEKTNYLFQSASVKNKLLSSFSNAKNIPLKDLKIIKIKSGIPKLFLNSTELKCSISLTHHGNYCGYTFSI